MRAMRLKKHETLLLSILLVTTACMAVAPQSDLQSRADNKLLVSSSSALPATIRYDKERRSSFLSHPNHINAIISANSLKWGPDALAAQGFVAGSLTNCKEMTPQRSRRMYANQVELIELANYDFSIKTDGVFVERNFNEMMAIFDLNFELGKKSGHDPDTCAKFLDDFEKTIFEYE